MRKQDSTLREGRSTTQNKLIKGTDSLFLNSEIGFGYTCKKKDFQHKGDLSCFQKKMDLFKSLSASMTMHDLSNEYNVSSTFNVTDLSPFGVGDDLRTNPFQEKGNDEGTTNKWNANPIQVPVGLITRARVKKFKETLNGLILNI